MAKSKEEWVALIGEQERAGKTAREFCAERGISEESFYAKRSEYKTRERRNRFAKVERSNSRIELELSNGIKLRVERLDLKVVLEALQ